MGKEVAKRVREGGNGAARVKAPGDAGENGHPASLSTRIAVAGLRTSRDVAAYCAALVADLHLKKITARDMQAANGGIRNLLKTQDMEQRYGVQRDTPGKDRKVLELT